MFKFVKESQVAPYKSLCQSALDKMAEKLKREHGITAHVVLIGSGAENMVTRNGKGPFDLDYNLVFTFIPREYSNAPGDLKLLIKGLLDETVPKTLPDGRKLSHGKDSTSSITYLLHSPDKKKLLFKFDVALILENENGYSRLIHDKKNERFIWNQIPQSKGLKAKINKIQAANQQDNVAKIYLQKKNIYLSRQDRDHPSYIVYIEAVNQVYQTL